MDAVHYLPAATCPRDLEQGLDWLVVRRSNLAGSALDLDQSAWIWTGARRQHMDHKWCFGRKVLGWQKVCANRQQTRERAPSAQSAFGVWPPLPCLRASCAAGMADNIWRIADHIWEALVHRPHVALLPRRDIGSPRPKVFALRVTANVNKQAPGRNSHHFSMTKPLPSLCPSIRTISIIRAITRSATDSLYHGPVISRCAACPVQLGCGVKVLDGVHFGIWPQP